MTSLRTRSILGALTLAPLLLLTLFVGGAAARTESQCSPTVFEPKEDMRLEKRAAFRAHEPWVRALAFNPCGTLLASGGKDGKLRLWDMTAKSPRANVQTWSTPPGVC